MTATGLMQEFANNQPQKLALPSMVWLQQLFNNVAEVTSLPRKGFTEMTRKHSIRRLRECDVRISFQNGWKQESTNCDGNIGKPGKLPGPCLER